MSVRSRQLARAKGAFAADPSAAKLWGATKRELLEAALRLTMKEDAQQAVDAVLAELAILRGQGIV